MPRPTIIKFYLEHSDDEEVTCFFCKGKKCELSFTIFGDGDRRMVGAHAECVERHDARQHKSLEQANGDR